MHHFQAFTFAVIVIWCHVKSAHTKSQNKSRDYENSSHKISSLFSELVKTSSLSPHTTKSIPPLNNTSSDGKQSPSSTVFKIALKTTGKENNDKISHKVESSEVQSENKKPNIAATPEANATKPTPVFRSRMKHRQRHPRFRTNGTRYGNSTLNRQRFLRKGFRPQWRTLENGTRVRLRRGRGNMTIRMRAQRNRKQRKRRTTTSTKKPLRETGLFETTDISMSDNELKKKVKHHTSSTNKVTRDGNIFSDHESETEHYFDLAAVNMKDPPMSDTEHMDLLKDQKSSTKKVSSDNHSLSDKEHNNDISLSENEHKELTNHHTKSTKKKLRIRPEFHNTTTKKDDDFSYNESKESVVTSPKTRTYRWPKRKDKRIGRAGKKYGRHQQNGNRQTGEKRKPNQNKHATETTQQKKTTKAYLGHSFKPYTIKAHLEALKCKFNNINITLEVIGRTLSYYDIVMLRASAKRNSYNNEIYFRGRENKFADDGPEKRIVFIVHGLSVMGIHGLPCLLEVKEFETLLSYYFSHLDKFDIFLIPMANPDGVAVPNSSDKRFNSHSEVDWNKNTSPQSECPGVALDRNFDVAWNIRRNLSSCNQQYPGPHPFSENETRAIREVLHRYSQRIVAYFNVHAGTYTAKIFKGDAVLYPKGYTQVQSDDDRYIDLRGEIDETLKNASFQVYTVSVDTLYSWYGKVGGTSVDYAAGVYGIPYSMELVMQLYDEEDAQDAVLRTSWRRVIDVIFNSVHRYVNVTGSRRLG